MSGMNNTYFTSDLHIGHYNIIRYSGRVFTSSQQMDEQLILNWNNTVGQNDSVYCLGDMFMSNDYDHCQNIANRLNGKIYLIIGNHSKTDWKMKDRFEWIKDYFKLSIQDNDVPKGVQQIIMCHYAFRVWDQSHRGSISIFGHSHNSLPDDPNILSMDVGVDAIAARLGKKPENYRPISYAEVKKIMSKKNWVSPIKNRDE